MQRLEIARPDRVRRTTLVAATPSELAEIPLPRPPNFKHEKKRREEAQKKRNEQKQADKASRKGGVEPAKTS